MDRITAYLPPDRYRALALGTKLPPREGGAVLFADIAGFTALTEALLQSRGQRHGAEELADRLNAVYTDVIGEVERAGGSVISFSGDAITAWFARDDGRRAIASGMAIQQSMQRFSSATLAVKVAIVCGPARRYLVGDEAYGLIDVLAGATIDRLAALEQAARPGEVLLDEATAQRWDDWLEIDEWRQYDPAAGPAAVVRAWRPAAPIDPGPADRDHPSLDDEHLRAWLVPAVWSRFQAGQGEFLTELRPAIALFLRFTGLAYDTDGEAEGKLDRFVRWVQQVAAQFGGTLLQLTIGDKGSYAYLCFGAPVAHDDDPIRAVRAAERLRTAPAEHDCIQTIQIGLGSGIMRTGAYGAPQRRTYGALGDGVNIAARLMVLAEPGQILADAALAGRLGGPAAWDPLAPVALKGKATHIEVHRLRHDGALHLRQRPSRSQPTPLIGRGRELAALDAALAGQGWIIGLVGEAGIGKSRLIEEWAGRSAARGLAVYQGAASSYGLQTPYLAWQPVWRDFFGLDGNLPPEQVAAQLADALAEFDPDFPLRAPLLGPVLNIAIPDTDFTREFDARLRKQSREALLVESLRMRALQQSASGSGTVIILEDAHGLDALSHELLEAIGRVLGDLPVLIVLVSRPPQSPEQPWPDPARLERFAPLPVAEFSLDEATELSAATLASLGYAEAVLAPSVVMPLMERTRGNPFYLEEVLHYLHGQGADPRRAEAWPAEPLPLSLQSVILSRVDHLPATHQNMLKSASIIGLLFAADWLCGYSPGLGGVDSVGPELDALCERHLLRWIATDPTYAFHHGLTQEVLYASLPAATRARLHERLGEYLEAALGNGDAQVNLLAYHYGRSANLPKKRHYLRRAGDLAAAAYANAAAIVAYGELLPLLDGDPAERGAVLRSLGSVLVLVGRWDDAQAWYEQALQLAEASADGLALAQTRQSLGDLLIKRGQIADAVPWLRQAARGFRELGKMTDFYRTLGSIGTCLRTEGKLNRARRLLEAALKRAYAGQLPEAVGHLTNILGNTLRRIGMSAEAETCFQESLAISRALRRKQDTAGFLNNLAAVADDQAQSEVAKRYYEQSLAQARQIGDKQLEGRVLLNMGIVLSDLVGDEMAQAYLQEGLGIAQELKAKELIVSAQTNIGMLALGRDDLDLAYAMNSEGLALAREMNMRPFIVMLLQQLSDVHRVRGAAHIALTQLHESIELADAINFPALLSQGFSRVAAILASQDVGGLRDGTRLCGWVNAAAYPETLYETQLIEQTVDRLRQSLGGDEFSELWAAGGAMPLDEAIAISRAWAEKDL